MAIDYKKVFKARTHSEYGLTAMVYIFYGSGKIGKTIFGKGIKDSVKDFKHMNIETITLDNIKPIIDKGFCIIVDGLKSDNEAIRFARYLVDNGIKCTLVEFKVFA